MKNKQTIGILLLQSKYLKNIKSEENFKYIAFDYDMSDMTKENDELFGRFIRRNVNKVLLAENDTQDTNKKI